MPIDFNQLREFVEAIAKTDITDLTIKEGDFELNMRKELPSGVTYNLPVSPPQPIIETKPTTNVNLETPSSNKPSEEIISQQKSDQWVAITSPMVGTFYRAPAPGESAFVEVGDHISEGQAVCIIEAMKLMNEIEAEVTGEVVEIVAQNGEPLEYGQTLMWINPSN